MEIIHIKQVTYRSGIDAEFCCFQMRNAWNDGVVSAPYASNSQLCLDKQHYECGVLKHTYSYPLKMCPWCGAAVTYREETR